MNLKGPKTRFFTIFLKIFTFFCRFLPITSRPNIQIRNFKVHSVEESSKKSLQSTVFEISKQKYEKNAFFLVKEKQLFSKLEKFDVFGCFHPGPELKIFTTPPKLMDSVFNVFKTNYIQTFLTSFNLQNQDD